MLREATISDDTQFRYRLDRIWDARLPKVCWIMLNPSTADGLVDDHTVRKCIAFSSIWGYGSFVIVNLWAYRARDPKHLAKNGWQAGPHNDMHIIMAMNECDRIVCAWGMNIAKFPGWEAKLWALKQLTGTRQLSCLKLLGGGVPGHPLMLSYKANLKAYELP